MPSHKQGVGKGTVLRGLGSLVPHFGRLGVTNFQPKPLFLWFPGQKLGTVLALHALAFSQGPLACEVIVCLPIIPVWAVNSQTVITLYYRQD